MSLMMSGICNSDSYTTYRTSEEGEDEQRGDELLNNGLDGPEKQMTIINENQLDIQVSND